MIVRQNDDRTQIAVLEDGVLVEHYVAAGDQRVDDRQRLPRPGAERAAEHGGRVRRHRQGPQRRAVRRRGQLGRRRARTGQPRADRAGAQVRRPVLVQVTKDPIGHKGARLTSQVSLPGRYLVYVPGRLDDRHQPQAARHRARRASRRSSRRSCPDDAGVIVRTAAEGATEEELRARRRSACTAQWEDIETQGARPRQRAGAAARRARPAIRVVRDIFNEDFAHARRRRATTPGTTIDATSRSVAPDLADRVSQLDRRAATCSPSYRIDEQLAKALDRKVWLPSGGSLVIDRTEAMTVVDVNTGKFTGSGGNLEETVTKNNLEAAEEIVRQLRLRDIGGIIVVDFIDMVLETNRDLVLRRLVECLGRDRTKHQVAEVTSLGLVQMTRKRVGQGLLEVVQRAVRALRRPRLHRARSSRSSPRRHVPRPRPAAGAAVAVARAATASRRDGRPTPRPSRRRASRGSTAPAAGGTPSRGQGTSTAAAAAATSRPRHRGQARADGRAQRPTRPERGVDARGRPDGAAPSRHGACASALGGPRPRKASRRPAPARAAERRAARRSAAAAGEPST